MAPPRPPPELMNELVEEVLLRLPPDDPASLARAALVCRRWRRLISDPGFRRRFRDLHRPPMLGVLRNFVDPDGTALSRFVPTSSFCPPRADRRDLRAIDSRHGLVLLCSVYYPRGPWENGLLVWDPVTGDDWEVPAPRPPYSDYWCWYAVVLCAASLGGGGGRSCYVGCRRDPFLVVVVGISYATTFACVYSSEAGVWSEHTHGERIKELLPPAVLVGDVLHFTYLDSTMIFKYDVATSEMSLIHLPDSYYAYPLRRINLMTTEDGRLGFAVVEESRLFLWEADSHRARGWSVNRFILLDSVFPDDALRPAPQTVGFAECCGFILLWTPKGYFIFDPKSDQVTKVGEDEHTISVVPYVSFCIPALGATSAGEGPKADDPCASTSKVTSSKIL